MRNLKSSGVFWYSAFLIDTHRPVKTQHHVRKESKSESLPRPIPLVLYFLYKPAVSHGLASNSENWWDGLLGVLHQRRDTSTPEKVCLLFRTLDVSTTESVYIRWDPHVMSTQTDRRSSDFKTSLYPCALPIARIYNPRLREFDSGSPNQAVQKPLSSVHDWWQPNFT